MRDQGCEIKDAGQVVMFYDANWTVEERRRAVAQIDRLPGLYDNDGAQKG